jgi:hypothetical protein
MINRLQFRLLMAFILVILVAIGTISIFASYTLISEVRQYDEYLDQLRLSRTERTVMRFYFERGNWIGIQSLIEPMESLYGRRVVLTNSTECDYRSAISYGFKG